ncbi:ABC transporter permease [Arthrobacter sp. MYb23]|uniref:ABC transporter permease n=1 Tax=unclassified Arthrobacter TaxID=235627 RepID=UPI000CFB165A|nr:MULTISPECIES: ABC transporter permease [unclassified Arthrobacter]PRB41082.1 ABC transporter permease [Arthrobacter sp. MYb51]PRB94752.1 ABC transporter permease [Arthrobacter sp. MYb23]
MSARHLALFLARRAGALVIMLAILSFLIYSLLYLAPGSPVDILLGNQPRTPETVRLLNEKYHLDQPFLTQYWIWAQGALQLDFGTSILTTLPVSEEIGSRLPVSIFLGIYAYILTMIGGVGLGVLSALRRKTVVDRGIVGASVIALSTPAFVSGVFLLFLFAITVQLFPATGIGEDFVGRLWHLTLPAVALALTVSAFVLKHTRAAVLAVIDQDYVTFARARGLSPIRIMSTYVLRNALIPIVTISGLVLGSLITGAFLVEVTFSVPGIGQLLVDAAVNKDLPLIQGVAMIIAVVIILANLLADLLYMAIDPRIRVERKSV